MGYSAKVDGWLEIDGESFKMGQIGPEWIKLRDAPKISPRHGEIVISIDDREDRFSVFLPNGIDPTIAKTLYVKLVKPPTIKPAIQLQFAWALIDSRLTIDH